MAEIHVQTNKNSSPVWVWVVLALVVIGALVYFLTRNQHKETSTDTRQGTSLVAPAAPSYSVAADVAVWS